MALNWSAVIWLGWFGAWVVLELAGYWHLTPWTTLSEFVWSLEGAWAPLRFVFFLGMSILAAHLATRWP